MIYFQLFEKTSLRGPQGYGGGGGGGGSIEGEKNWYHISWEVGWKFPMIKVGFYLLTCSLKYFANKTPIFTVQNVPKNAFWGLTFPPPPDY